MCHVQLAELRPSNQDASRYKLPSGRAFQYVCCPHYTCEAMAWVMFVLIAPTRPGVLFLILASTIMV